MNEEDFRFRVRSCDFVDRPKWGKIRSTKSHETARKKRQVLRTGASHTTRVLLLLMIFISSVTWSFATRRERLIDFWKPLNYDVSLTLNDQLTAITSARAEITILSLKDTLSQIDLDFGELAVDSVTVNGETTRFDRAPDLLNINLSKAAPRNTRLVVVVSYHG